MPLQWTIDAQSRTVDVVARDLVTMPDVMAFLGAIEEAAALPYSMLFDGSEGRSEMTGEEMMAIVARIRGQHGLSVVGALAVVANREQAHQFARVLGAAAVADRPMKVFDDLKPARRWLEAQLPVWP